MLELLRSSILVLRILTANIFQVGSRLDLCRFASMKVKVLGMPDEGAHGLMLLSLALWVDICVHV